MKKAVVGLFLSLLIMSSAGYSEINRQEAKSTNNSSSSFSEIADAILGIAAESTENSKTSQQTENCVYIPPHMGITGQDGSTCNNSGASCYKSDGGMGHCQMNPANNNMCECM